MGRVTVQCGIIVLAVSILSQFKSLWLFDLLAELTPLWILLCLPGLVFALHQRLKIAIATHALALVVLAISTWLAFRPLAESPLGQGRLKILQANLYKLNTETRPVLDIIRKEGPDIIALFEVVPAHQSLLGALGDYPHRARAPYRLGMDLLILSRHPIESIPLAIPSTLACRVKLGGRSITLISTHPPIPQSPAGWSDRNRILLAAANRLNVEPVPRILLGDFNATPFSGAFKRIEDSGLRNSARGLGYFPTWPDIAVLPLDHLLISPEFGVAEKHVGPQISSDHRPVITTLSF